MEISDFDQAVDYISSAFQHVSGKQFSQFLIFDEIARKDHQAIKKLNDEKMILIKAWAKSQQHKQVNYFKKFLTLEP